MSLFCFNLIPKYILKKYSTVRFSALFGDKVRGFVVGGQDAPTGSWPWMVHFNITSDGRHTWRCGGTILDNYWILTAAHCWDRWGHSLCFIIPTVSCFGILVMNFEMIVWFSKFILFFFTLYLIFMSNCIISLNTFFFFSENSSLICLCPWPGLAQTNFRRRTSIAWACTWW